MDEVITRFGTGTAQREFLVSYLLRIYALVSATGQLERFIIFGSYVTAKADPNDVDVFLVMAEAFNVDEMSGDTRVIILARARAEPPTGQCVLGHTEYQYNERRCVARRVANET